jgi:hypothetical protein
MKRSMQLLTVGGLFALAIALSQATAQAQNQNMTQTQMRIMQERQMAQRLVFNQWRIDRTALRIDSTRFYGTPINPVTAPNLFAGAYNPAFYPTSPYTPSYYPPVGTPYTAPLVNPYAPTAPGYGANPYAPTDPSLANPYNPYGPYNPYYNNYGAGSVLTGAADVIRANGQFMNSAEMARILREKALQAKQETRKLTHDTDMYIEATTPTFTQKQERVAKNTLQRIQKNSMPGEITNGKALNLLLKDLLTFRPKVSSFEPPPLSEGVLAQMNVTKSTYGMGLLRDNGKISMPSVVKERMTLKEREDFEKKLETMVKDANAGRINKDTLADVRNEIERVRDELVKKVNDIPTAPYLEGKRFLQELDEACRAVDLGEAINQRDFQIWLEKGKGTRGVKELVDYMGDNALRFGPATPADEASYRAVYQALASYDLAMNQQYAPEER